jgi:hypothetical protein
MASWQNTSLLMLRTMLNDAGCGETKYSNSRLEQLLITSAYFLPVDINFNTSYVIDVEQNTITPDPISQDDGQEFISFMVLKAACIADEGNFRNQALLQGVKARCGPAVLDTSSYGQYLKDLLSNGPCKTYDDLKDEYNFSYEGRRIIRAVMSPFVSNDFYPPLGGAGNGQLDTSNYNRSRNY